MAEPSHHSILIVGGGAAGITVAARLCKRLPRPSLAIVEPSDKHFYQPLWTLVGGGAASREASVRSQARCIPAGATWIRDAVTAFRPEENHVLIRDGRRLSYDFLVVAPGIQIDWGKIRGLPGNLGCHGICSNYSYESLASTWETIRNFRGGIALFTMPDTPVKCGGAPQKIMYLAEDHFRSAGVRDRSTIMYTSATAGIFAVPKYAQALEKVIARKAIQTRFRHNLIEIRPEAHEAVFEHLDTHQQVVLPYDMIHVTPPMSTPDFIKRSPLATEAGWVDVDRHTLRHVRFANVFALGDASSLPPCKTAAAVRKQAPVVVENLLAAMRGQPLPAHYDGYTSCPLVTGYGRLVLAEFDYQQQPKETFPFDQGKERLSMYLLKKFGLPLLYWHGMLKGRL